MSFSPANGPPADAGKHAVAGAKIENATVRVDSGVYEGGNISMYYDPMIAKLVTHAPTRAGALACMEGALDRYRIEGLGNNLAFLRSVCRNDKFVQGDYGTSFIAEQYPDGFHGVLLLPKERRQVCRVFS